MSPENKYDLPEPNQLIIVLSGLSGVGKDTVLKHIQERGCSFHFVVTATTRPPREGEVHGKDYWFVTRDEFSRMLSRRTRLVAVTQVSNALGTLVDVAVGTIDLLDPDSMPGDYS